MKKILYTLIFFIAVSLSSAEAGNPDRQGEAGAAQLLLNPWARSAGLHSMTSSMVRGVQSMQINVAGLGRISKTEFAIGHTRYLEGTDIGLNAFGFAQKIGENGTLGVTINTIDMGSIAVTTESQPNGTGATFEPRLSNIALGYAHTFENKISVGILARGVSEATSDISAFGLAIDAGIQYVSGEEDNFKFGISLRNVGTRMTFGGQGLSEQLSNPNNDQFSYSLSYFQRSQGYELPSLLNIGLSYDFLFGMKKGMLDEEGAEIEGKNSKARHRITPVVNFTANSFSQDQFGGGIEYSFNDMFILRGGYRYEFGQEADGGAQAPVESGPCGGLTVNVPLNNQKTRYLGIDYAYRATQPWDGSHSLTVRLNL